MAASSTERSPPVLRLQHRDRAATAAAEGHEPGLLRRGRSGFLPTMASSVESSCLWRGGEALVVQ